MDESIPEEGIIHDVEGEKALIVQIKKLFQKEINDAIESVAYSKAGQVLKSSHLPKVKQSMGGRGGRMMIRNVYSYILKRRKEIEQELMTKVLLPQIYDSTDYFEAIQNNEPNMEEVIKNILFSDNMLQTINAHLIPIIYTIAREEVSKHYG